jgi:ribosome-associated toxin RatA of RatAB toxin-antitoxin module
MVARMLSGMIAAGATLMLLPAFAAAQDAQDSWLTDPQVQGQLATGQVVNHSQLDGAHARAHIDAAIRIDASAQTVWKLLTQCQYASIYIPGLRHCRVIDSAPDGSWAVVEHDIKYSALAPMVHSVFRADYQQLQRIDFHRVSGDFKSEVGMWLLQPSADHSVTIEYRVSIQPGFWVPRSMVQRSLKRQLPAALVALRARAERMAAAAAADATASSAATVPAVPAGPAVSPSSPD